MTQNLREEIHQLHAQICSGLADPSRILILYSLSEKSSNVNELSNETNLPQPTISRHLKTLRECGLVTFRRDGQYVYYQLADKRIIEALDLMRAVMADNLKERAQIAVAAAQDSISN
ncbi:MAG: winged helix-turn-helix transcriptional regulator [Anaerolineales bacterium]|uniref:Winged helix-turn-helix transcriptional regulator n=1 Tax=Candidatus Desulfolinea nitratireducens TaxID=2841698 RepID=A0A8J6TH86_9CHLR|nr:winged helix-turn-helix transcriptional regulator [Candidatus Desulfolinea nitratireducens]MBL6960713.1 winged helix-turn-helix transcriptional regulator [Anaerolineales bacterium]